MAEKKNTQFNRPGGYAQPKGAIAVQKRTAKALAEAEIKLYGDSLPSHIARGMPRANCIEPAYHDPNPDTRLYIGDCREILAQLPDKGNVDLIFADPPFNWDVPYAGSEGSKASRQQGIKGSSESGTRCLDASMPRCLDAWNDSMSRAEYERFTFDWLDLCIECLAPHGSLWVNIPDDTAAEVVLHCKRRGLTMINWCIWHFRFGQNRNSSFIMSKVHALYFAKSAGIKATRDQRIKEKHTTEGTLDASLPGCLDASSPRIWNPNEILELSDRASIYFDPRTMNKDSNKGLRVPMDVWYGKYWGRIQGNNKERRHNHHNQIPEIYLERVIKACSYAAGTKAQPIEGTKPRRDEGTKGKGIATKRRSDEATKGLDAQSPDGQMAKSPHEFGSLVLDPFCGSGTTSTVARALGRRSITIEYSPVNAASAWERIINVGMIPREDAGKPQSTAIFGSRRKRQKRATLNNH